MLHFAGDGSGDQLFLIAEQSVPANCDNLETTKGVELGGTSHEGGKIRRQIKVVDMKGVLELHGERVKISGD